MLLFQVFVVSISRLCSFFFLGMLKVETPSPHAKKVCPEVPSTPKAESPGRFRLAALESGFSSIRTEIASMFASLQASRRPNPQIPKPAGPVIATG